MGSRLNIPAPLLAFERWGDTGRQVDLVYGYQAKCKEGFCRQIRKSKLRNMTGMPIKSERHVQLSLHWQEKPLASKKVIVPETDTGGRVEHTQVLR